MNRVLAWILTFNFVNIAWVFFRAKTWDDAIKVLAGMFGLSGIKLPKSAAKIGMFQGDNVVFGDLFFKAVDRRAIYYIILAMLITLLAKNSNQQSESFKPTRMTAAFTIVIALYALLNMSKVSEFLYFNF
jgi:D-alanyl-lipoteichoic acid acyltransferase DltB (MBOAT superfamily)